MTPSPNFIPETIREARQSRRILRRWLAAISVCLVTVIIAGVMRVTGPPAAAASAGSLADLEAEAESIMAEITLLSRRLNHAAAGPTGVPLPQSPDWSRFFRMIGSLVEGQIALTEMIGDVTAAERDGQDVEQFTLTLNGLADSHSVVTDFVLRLETCGVFDEVRLLGSQRQNQNQTNLIRFAIQCVVLPASEDGR